MHETTGSNKRYMRRRPSFVGCLRLSCRISQ